MSGTKPTGGGVKKALVHRGHIRTDPAPSCGYYWQLGKLAKSWWVVERAVGVLDGSHCSEDASSEYAARRILLCDGVYHGDLQRALPGY